MNHFKKQFFLVLFMLCAGLFVASSANAQTWNAVDPSVLNTCFVASGSTGQCQCPSGYTYGHANETNCKYDGAIVGCWNPGTGKCQECGTGGTVTLGASSCFNNGQGSVGGDNPGNIGGSCTQTSSAPYSTCVNSGTTTGGFSTN